MKNNPPPEKLIEVPFVTPESSSSLQGNDLLPKLPVENRSEKLAEPVSPAPEGLIYVTESIENNQIDDQGLLSQQEENTLMLPDFLLKMEAVRKRGYRDADLVSLAHQIKSFSSESKTLES